jgi:2-methylcitrate dehydratase PrpD
MNVTRSLTQKCFELDYNQLPEEVIDRVRYFTLDYLGVAARGSLSESSRPVYNAVRRLDASGTGTPIIGTDFRAAPPYAALANGISAHSLELDDVVNAASLHPGVTIITAALSAADISGCSAKEFVEGVVAGYEVTVKLGIALDPAAHYARGFHPTATCGTMGAAVAVAKIFRLSPEEMTNALGIAGSQAAGSMEFLAEGAFTKRFHAGWAAHSGLMAALLARENFTGPGTIIEGKFGFLHSYSDNSDPERVLKDWANPYEVMKTSIKPHSCCRYKQGPIDGVLRIVRENHLRADDIESIEAAILSAGFSLVAEPELLKQNPKSIVDAQFSMPFGATVAVLFGKATLDEYTPENIASEQVKALMKRVSCVKNPELDKVFPQKWPALVKIATKDGRSFQTDVEFPKGDPENPLSWDEIIEKFNGLASPVYSPERRQQIVATVRGLDRDQKMNTLTGLLPKG